MGPFLRLHLHRLPEPSSGRFQKEASAGQNGQWMVQVTQMYKNTVNLIGFVGKDAEVKAAQDNSTNFTVLSLATKESWKNKQTNEWESRTEWHRILVFGKLGDFAATLTKGAHIEVEGTLRSREQTLELKGSSNKNPETKNVRSWFIRAESIRKLDRAEKSSEDAGADDVPF